MYTKVVSLDLGVVIIVSILGLFISTIGVFDGGINGDKHEDKSNDSSNEVQDGKVRVVTSKAVQCGELNRFLTLEVSNIVIVLNMDLVSSSIFKTIKSTIQLSEVGESRSSHPNHEVLYYVKKSLILTICHVHPLDILPGFGTVDNLGVVVLVGDIGGPSDSGLIQSHIFSEHGGTLVALRALFDMEGIIEGSLRDQTAGDSSVIIGHLFIGSVRKRLLIFFGL